MFIPNDVCISHFPGVLKSYYKSEGFHEFYIPEVPLQSFEAKPWGLIKDLHLRYADAPRDNYPLVYDKSLVV